MPTMRLALDAPATELTLIDDAVIERAYHGMVALVADTVICEVKTGPYDPTDDKSFGPFSPVEGSPEADAYRRQLVHHAHQTRSETP